ncbi:MAG TPA: response regulator [Chloroflexota bacterium]|nr:response regulator [Chloroflexota bacterium]HEX2988092.1 response regulator [Chloroflexota bacterium]
MGQRRVLIVEDEPDNQEIVRAVVEDIIGCSATLACDGLEAISKAREDPPALVLLDLMLPKMDGYEVARLLRQEDGTRRVPIIAITALARPSDRIKAMESGCNDYVDKPFDLEALEQKIRARVFLSEEGSV